MRICVWGLGYVGVVSVACLAEFGHDVIGVDINANKVAQVNRQAPTIVEAGLADLMQKNASRIRATTDAHAAVASSDVSLICVGTPGAADGQPELSGIFRVAESIAGALRGKDGYHVIAVRSTVPPGTSEDLARLVARVSGRKEGADFEIVANPEFLREGTAITDFFDPPFTVIGVRDPAVRAVAVFRDVYAPLKAGVSVVDRKVAEVIKLVCNSWHAVKVSFANETGNICSTLGIDGQKVMDLFSLDTKLNLSGYYLRPGFAYGGSCLPKDLRAFRMLARAAELETPMLDSLDASNNHQIDRALGMIRATGARRIGFLGVSFKSGTDDVRVSPKLALCLRLIAQGFDVRVHDANVHASIENEINRTFLLPRLHDVAERLVRDVGDAIAGADLVVLANNEAHYRDIGRLMTPQQTLFELDRFSGEVPGGRIRIA